MSKNNTLPLCSSLTTQVAVETMIGANLSKLDPHLTSQIFKEWYDIRILGIIGLGGEYSGVKGRQMVDAVRLLFEGMGFKVYETSYDGPKTCMIKTSSGEGIRFDMFMKHESGGPGVHYLCECKFRSDASQKAEVRSQFRDFLCKALKALPYFLEKYGEHHFCFLFISSIPFDIWEENLNDPAELLKMLEEKTKLGAQENSNVHILSHHIRLMIMPGWLISTLPEVSGK